MAALLDIRGLEVQFAADGGTVPVLNGIDLVVEPGESLGVVGESGSGKTVLLRAILGLLRPPWLVRRGAVIFQGEDLRQNSEAELNARRGRDIALTTPEPRKHLNPLLRVGEQIVNVLRAHRRMDRRAAQVRAIELLRAVGIPAPELRVRAYPHEMSGGMCQRVIIAMALAHDPKLLLADEPTAGLDVTISRQILDLMQELIQRTGSSMLLVSRDLGVVAHYCRRIAVVYAGQIVEIADVETFFADAIHPYSRKLLRAAAAAHNAGARASDGHGQRAHRCRPGQVFVCRPMPDRAALLPRKPAAAGDGRRRPRGALLSRRRDRRRGGHAVSGAPLLEVDDLVMHFPQDGRRVVKAVNGVSFQIRPGEALALVGESGSGKTTVGRAIMRLIEPTAGRVSFRGQDSTALPQVRFRPMRARLQMVFQEPFASLNPRMRIGRIVEEPLLLAGERSARVRRDRCVEVLRLVGLTADARSRFPHQFSAGEQQRIGIARAIATKPDSGGARRADLGAGRIGPRGHSRPARRPAARAEPCVPVHLARSHRGQASVSARGGDVSWPHRRGGRDRRAVRAAVASLQPRAVVVGLVPRSQAPALAISAQR